MLVIAIQSQVVVGHVGNSAAAFPMRAAGVEVLDVPTTLLSNHPRYPTVRGRVLEADLVADLLRGVEERDAPARAAVVLTGYMGSTANAEVVADFVARAKAVNPTLLHVCDPVMGDEDVGFFAPPDLVAAFRDRLIPLADVLTPNRFELSAITGAPAGDGALSAQAAGSLRRTVAVTGVFSADGATVSTIVTSAGAAWSVTTPRLHTRPAGTGDLFAGLFAARVAQRVAAQDAAALAVSGVFAALRHTPAERWAEMPITARIEAILRPDPLFPAEPL
ncbi:MAG: pyridoxal kinase [Rubrimonas sp.]